MRILSLFGITTTALTFVLVGEINAGEPSAPVDQTLKVSPEDLKAVVDGNNSFASDLYLQLAGEKNGNLFFSPHSVSNALAIALAGANGKTAEAIAKTIRARASSDVAYHAAFGQVNSRTQAAARKSDAQLSVANAVWRQNELLLNPLFVADCKRNYEVEFKAVDFKSDPEGARLSINRWVEAKTNDKIKELLRPGSVGNSARFVLVNAIYFKGKWGLPSTRNGPAKRTSSLCSKTSSGSPR